jgi:hypothetical protein
MPGKREESPVQDISTIERTADMDAEAGVLPGYSEIYYATCNPKTVGMVYTWNNDGECSKKLCAEYDDETDIIVPIDGLQACEIERLDVPPILRNNPYFQDVFEAELEKSGRRVMDYLGVDGLSCPKDFNPDDIIRDSNNQPSANKVADWIQHHETFGVPVYGFKLAPVEHRVVVDDKHITSTFRGLFCFNSSLFGDDRTFVSSIEYVRTYKNDDEMKPVITVMNGSIPKFVFETTVPDGSENLGKLAEIVNSLSQCYSVFDNHTEIVDRYKFMSFMKQCGEKKFISDIQLPSKNVRDKTSFPIYVNYVINGLKKAGFNLKLPTLDEPVGKFKHGEIYYWYSNTVDK